MSSKYLDKKILDGFDNYKYSSLDTSPISKYIMHPFWNWLVQFYPMWLAPNLITMCGFSLLVLSSILLTFYDPYYYASNEDSFYPPIPRAIFLICAFCFFWAHQLDGTDGKQARRIGSSTPLGELMDHGLDSWASVLMPYCFVSIFGLGAGSEAKQMWFVLLSVTIMFFLTHWEKYNTGLLYLPWGYDISQLGMSLIFLITFFIGTDPFKKLMPLQLCTYVRAFEFFVHASVWVLGIPMCLYNIFCSYKNKTGPQLSFFDAVSPLIPIFIHLLLTNVWLYYSSYHILEKHTRLFMLAYGSVYSNITCRCIVNCMSKTACDTYNHMLTPLILFVVLLLLVGDLGRGELVFLWLYFISTFIAQLLYAYNVVIELAAHFKIHVFRVKNPEISKSQK